MNKLINSIVQVITPLLQYKGFMKKKNISTMRIRPTWLWLPE